jgi:transcriptional regulator with XRE-family HTH domain
MNNETHDPRISTLLHICEAFNISLNEFFEDKLFDEIKSE